jgi:hypothetical protein
LLSLYFFKWVWSTFVLYYIYSWKIIRRFTTCIVSGRFCYMALMLKFNSYFNWCCFIIKLIENIFHLLLFIISLFQTVLCWYWFGIYEFVTFLFAILMLFSHSQLNCGVCFLFTNFIFQGFWGLQQSRNGLVIALCVIGLACLPKVGASELGKGGALSGTLRSGPSLGQYSSPD